MLQGLEGCPGVSVNIYAAPPTIQSEQSLGFAAASAVPIVFLQLYNGDVDAMDVMVGLLAEKPLPGFIFGEAIYTIFALQVRKIGWSRRDQGMVQEGRTYGRGEEGGGMYTMFVL